MNEINKKIDILIGSEIVSQNMIKQDNIECCICLEFDWGVKLPNCSHYICSECYFKLYHYGYVEDTYYIYNQKPIQPKSPVYPIYPYINVDENIKIYNELTDDDTFQEWFINNNEDFYNCIKLNEFVDDVDINIKLWFVTNEKIKNYNNDLIQYNIEYEKYYIDCEKYRIDNKKYELLLEIERKNNCIRKCPLCRL
jgi:hypothetical protein